MDTRKLIGVMIASALAIIVGGCASGQSAYRVGYDISSIDRVAVVDVAGDITGETAKNQISDFFVMELLSKGYSPVERAQVWTLLDEQRFQAGDVTETSEAARVGRILNVPMVLIANITYGEKITMTAKMVDVEDGGIVWTGSGAGKTGKGLTTILGAAAGAVGGAAVAGGDSSNKVVGAIAGGVLGGVAGHALTPQQAEQTQKVIKKMCKNLPGRYGPMR